MTNLMQKFEKEQIEKLTAKKSIPAFRAGDTIKVIVKISEGERSRLQAFEGVCIARKNNSINSKFTVRKISHGEGVERIFPLFSPSIDKIEVVRKGNVKRAKLYYLRQRTGKSARIADRDRGEEADEYSMAKNSELINETDGLLDESQKKESDKVTEKNKVEEKTTKEESLPEPVAEPVAEEKKPVEEKSESTASQADKTEDAKEL